MIRNHPQNVPQITFTKMRYWIKTEKSLYSLNTQWTWTNITTKECYNQYHHCWQSGEFFQNSLNVANTQFWKNSHILNLNIFYTNKPRLFFNSSLENFYWADFLNRKKNQDILLGFQGKENVDFLGSSQNADTEFWKNALQLTIRISHL